MHRVDLLAVLERDQDVVHQRNRQVGWHQGGGSRGQGQCETTGQGLSVGFGEAPQAQQHPGRRHGLNFTAANRAVVAVRRQGGPARRAQGQFVDRRAEFVSTCTPGTPGLMRIEQGDQAQCKDVLRQRESPDCQPAEVVVQFQCADAAVVGMAQVKPVGCRLVQSPADPRGLATRRFVAVVDPGEQAPVGQDQFATDETQISGQVNQQRSERVLVGLERNRLRVRDGRRPMRGVLNRMEMLHMSSVPVDDRDAVAPNRVRDSRRAARPENIAKKT